MNRYAKEAAARGARWLDENFPGWESRIDINTLNLRLGEHCICGQVFDEFTEYDTDGDVMVSGYDYAIDTLFTEANSWISAWIPKGQTYTTPMGFKRRRANAVSVFLGFCADDETGAHGYGFGPFGWEDIQEAWVELLHERQLANA